MTNEELVENFSGIPEDLEYIIGLCADLAEGDVQEKAAEAKQAIRNFLAELETIGFEIG